MILKKYFEPVESVVRYLSELNKNGKKILEIGPGYRPFPLATHFIDHINLGSNVINLDVCNEKFPFEDDEFDFVYARHILEDVQNPVAAFNELVRVGKTGYVETPSVMAEVSRNIDGFEPCQWRGYIHHRYLFWNVKNTLFCIPKYPIIEFIDTPDASSVLLDEFNWNNYYHWNSKSDAKIYELKNNIDFNITTNYYEELIRSAFHDGVECSQEFKCIVTNTRL